MVSKPSPPVRYVAKIRRDLDTQVSTNELTELGLPRVFASRCHLFEQRCGFAEELSQPLNLIFGHKGEGNSRNMFETRACAMIFSGA
jgi:hypothetical protein